MEDPTIVIRKNVKPSQLRTQAAISSAQRQGLDIETNKKYNAGHNKQHTIDKNTAKLEQETEDFHLDKVSLDVGRLIQQHRQLKNLTQKELATQINEKPQVVADYEQGKAIPNQTVLSKLERTLGVKLRGKEKGQPLEFKKK